MNRSGLQEQYDPQTGRFFLEKAYHLAIASYVFLVMSFCVAYSAFGKNVKVVQLWQEPGTTNGLDRMSIPEH